jgi:hypothetical protein
VVCPSNNSPFHGVGMDSGSRVTKNPYTGN